MLRKAWRAMVLAVSRWSFLLVPNDAQRGEPARHGSGVLDS